MARYVLSLSGVMLRNVCIKDIHVGGNFINLTQRVPLSFPNLMRFYGTKPKKETKGKKLKPKVQVSEEEMLQVIDVNLMLENMKKAVEKLKSDYVKHLSLRTTPGAIENLPVSYDGNEYPLNQIAQLAKKNPQLFVINISSTPQATKSVLEAIEKSGMNLNPQQDGTTIFVTIPKVSKEHRQTLVNNAKTMFNNTKTSIQDIQNRFIKEAKKQKGLSEDLVFYTQQQIMVFAEGHIAEAEKLMTSKQAELLGNN